MKSRSPLLAAFLVATLLAPSLAFPAPADCCAGAMPCCRGAMTTAPVRAAAQDDGSRTALSAPIPACCQGLLPAAAEAADRKKAVPPPVVMALASRPIATAVTLQSAGRAWSALDAEPEDRPYGSRSARAPPAR